MLKTKPQETGLFDLSHDLKTPLHSILTSVSLLKNKLSDEESIGLAEIIDSKGHYLNSLLNNLLDYFELINHNLKPDLHDFNLCHELNEVEKYYSEANMEKVYTFDTYCDSEIAKIYRGDAARLKQILFQLLDQLSQLYSSGAFSIDISRTQASKKKATIHFKVMLEGQHPDKVKLGKLNLLLGSLNRKQIIWSDGPGIWFTNELCRLLGGQLSFFSTETGAGFKFSIDMNIPAIKKRNQEIKRILLVEDNIINQRLTRIMLENQGFDVTVANDGKQAVEVFESYPFDLILMDIQMPVMDGLEATRQIRLIENKHRSRVQVPIIALTANTQLQDKIMCENAGMNGFMNKPFKMENFPILVNNL